MTMPVNQYILKTPIFDKHDKRKKRILGYKERLVRICRICDKEEGKAYIEDIDGIGGTAKVSQYNLTVASKDDVKRLQSK